VLLLVVLVLGTHYWRTTPELLAHQLSLVLVQAVLVLEPVLVLVIRTRVLVPAATGAAGTQVPVQALGLLPVITTS
jgi:hypothetical protein